MSSILLSDVSTTANSYDLGNGGLLIEGNADESNFIVIDEQEGAESAANPGDDIIFGGDEFDVVFANDGDDLIFGKGGDDVLIGGEGDDVLIGGEGSDTLIGGEGADTFLYKLDDFANGEVDTVVNFESGVDQVIISGADPDLVTVDENMIKYDGETIIVSDDDFDELF